MANRKCWRVRWINGATAYDPIGRNPGRDSQGKRIKRKAPRPVQTIDFENRSNATSFCRTLVEEKGRENVAFMIIDLRPTKTPTNKPAAPIQISMIDLGRWPIRVRLGK